MRLRTFNAATIAEALRLARTELGPEAVILSTERIGKSVRLTAALEPPGQSAPPRKATQVPVPGEGVVELIVRALRTHNVPGHLIERLVAIIDGLSLEDPRQGLNAALRARFDFRPVTALEPGRPILLVGQPGAGKTSCAAKLAAMARAADQKATLITCDIAKAGAVQQLAIYARALGVPAYFARDAAALRRAVQRASPDSSIIIDTIGANPFAKAERDALRELAAASGAEPVLVQPCGGDPEEAAELAQCHAEIGVQRLIATRLDASRRLGGILAAADRAPLAFGALSMSPEIAAGLAAPDAATLSARLLPHIGHETQREQTSVPGSPS